ncbi:MAG: putative transcriptional regulator [Granulosicoccus sp.]|jgi:putative transcriptional regulator
MNFTHHFLVSMPQLNVGCFKDSVVYILDHSDNGAFGVIVNHEMGMNLKEIFSQLSISTADDSIGDIAVLHGGPVDEGHGLVLHKHGQKFESTTEFKGGISVSSSRDVLESIAKRDPPSQYLIFLGHAGWSAGQLESEVSHNAWLTVEASADILFDTPLDARRQAAGDQIGIDLRKLVAQSGHA